jgi:hypothetical protein
MRKKYFTDEERKAAKAASARKYYQSDSGNTKRRAYDKAQRILKRDDITKYRQTRRKTKDGYADRFMERIKLRTPDTDIDRDYLMSIFGDHCVISGRGFEYEKIYNAYHNALAPSIDRIDSKVGYYKGNVQMVLSCINRMKNDMPNEEFLNLWKALTT